MFKYKKQLNIILIIFQFIPIIAFSQWNNKTTELIDDIFFNLPFKGSKIEIINALNNSNYLEKVKTFNTEEYICEIKNHPYIDISYGRAYLITKFMHNKIYEYSIRLENQPNESNSLIITDLIESTGASYYKSGIDLIGCDHVVFPNRNDNSFIEIQICNLNEVRIFLQFDLYN